VLRTLTAEGKCLRILIRDRDVKLTKAFDDYLRSQGITVIRTPVAAPKAKAHAERWVGGVRRECLDRILILSRSHLERVLREYVDHHNTHTGHTAHSTSNHRSRSRFQFEPRLTFRTFADATDSADSCTNTNSPPSSYPLAALPHATNAWTARRPKPQCGDNDLPKRALNRQSNKRQRCHHWQLNQPKQTLNRHG
jgi:integrase-like protein